MISAEGGTRRIALHELNTVPAADFVRHLGGVFEHSPWIPRLAAALRPFSDIDSMHAAMMDIVLSQTTGDQIAFLRAHPRLAARAKRAGALTSESRSEQSHAGLDALDDPLADFLEKLNVEYEERFGFPFIIVARHNDARSIIAALQRRSSRTRDEEVAEALEQIAAITRIRLKELLI
jgi:2-oxo-4-hydroxy-4-carboxy-5-ureidoimidazoline decarboxylase